MGKKFRFPTEEEIRTKAKQICLERGDQPGHEIDDWLQAEYELMQLPIRKLAGVEPPKCRNGSKTLLVALVQVAVFWGAEALPHLNR